MNQHIPKKSLNSFRRVNLATVIAVFILILVGGIVRSTGSGMGCTDWPKCFGSVIPPTHVDQLPANYKEIYLEKRIEKNNRFIVLLQRLGFQKTAKSISEDKSILIEEDFNAVKTWIEYINRIIGVLIGLLILLTVYKSFQWWRIDPVIPIVSILNLLLVLFQGWIGSIVVSTNLLTWMITLHMVLALLIVCLLIYTYFRASRYLTTTSIHSSRPKMLFNILAVGFVLMLLQIVLGTQVREQVDQMAFQFGNMLRGSWVDALGLPFLIHRSYSILILLVHGGFLYFVIKFGHRQSKVYSWAFVLILFILLEMITGIGMAYFGIPPFLQPIHLLFGSLIIGVQFYLLMELNVEKKILKNTVHESN
jgi:heme a synthase